MSELEAITKSGRTRGYDLARAVAIVGMVLINFPIFLASTQESAGTLLAWFANVHSGRAAALFVTLAGAGIALMSHGANPWSVRRTLLLRAIFLFTVGSLLSLVWSIDILHFYAFYLALSALFLITLPRWALLLGAGLITAATLMVHILWPELETEFDAGILWPEFGAETANYWAPIGMLQNVFVSGLHPVLPWIAFVMIGLWIGRHDLTDAGTRGRLMVIGAALGIGAPLLSSALEQIPLAGLAPVETLDYLGVGHAPSPLYVLAAAGTSMFAIALCQDIVTRWGETLAVRALVHAGQLAFTIYLTHALLGVVIPQSVFGLDPMPLPWVIAYSLAFCLVVIALAHFYRLRFQRGPLEAAMRSLSGESPKKLSRPERPRLGAAARAWWPGIGAAAIALVTLQVVGVSPRLGCGPSAMLGERANSELTLSCLSRSFSVTVAERSDVTFETHSGRDLYLELYQGKEMIGENDDDGPGANARLVATLEPGAYRIRVRPYDAAVGPFILARSNTEPTVRELEPGQFCTDSCSTARDGECDDGGPRSLYAVCELGTDCADCGIRSDADVQSMLNEDGLLCLNTCAYANDRECDDGGPNSLYSACAYGSDCGDCGPRQPRFARPPSGNQQ